jgi:hypothetical protein
MGFVATPSTITCIPKLRGSAGIAVYSLVDLEIIGRIVWFPVVEELLKTVLTDIQAYYDFVCQHVLLVG